MSRLATVLSCAVVAVCLSICSVAPLTRADDDYRPKIAAASRDAELAMKGFVKPDGIDVQLLASEPALANPVAFYVSHDGKVYVCETFRQEVGVEDNRSHRNWLQNDLRLESVEERLAMAVPADARGRYQLKAQYLDRQTGETIDLATPPVTIQVKPEFEATAAPILDLNTRLRQLSQDLAAGDLDSLFSKVGYMNQYDPDQDYLKQTE